MSHKDKRETMEQDMEQAAWADLEEETAGQTEGTPQDEQQEETESSSVPSQDAALAKAQALAEEYLTLAQRVQADFDNFRKRNERIRADAYQEGKREVAAAMLPVLDNLERALQASAEGTGQDIRTGVEMILRQMQDIMTGLGISVINRLGEKFDPNLEDAVMQGSSEEGEPGTVCQVLQKGYIMGTQVLRHAMVKVVAE